MKIVLSFGLLAGALACGVEPPAPPPPAPAVAPSGGHAHEAPHGGVLVELGEEFGHIELVLDRASGSITAFVLDGEAEASVRLRQATIALRVKEVSFELAARANVLTGETVGDTSQFVLAHDAFKGLTAFQAVLGPVSYKGQEFRDVPVTYQASR
jgi:hypothetical protein